MGTLSRRLRSWCPERRARVSVLGNRRRTYKKTHRHHFNLFISDDPHATTTPTTYTTVHRSMPISEALQDYLPAFQGHEDEPFLTFYPVPSPSSSSSSSSTSTTKTTWTRGELWALAQRFAYILKHQAKLRKGDCQVHLFGANSVEDVALRLASVMVGTVPVTVNWDSDPIDRVVFKVSHSPVLNNYIQWHYCGIYI